MIIRKLTRRFAISAALTFVVGIVGCKKQMTADDYLSAGDQAFRDSQLATCEQDYQNAVRIAPDDARAHVALGNLYIFEHNSDGAQKEFTQAIHLDPKSNRAHAGLGRVYIDESQFGPAEEQYRAAIALDPANANNHLGLAAVLRRTRRSEEAEREYRTAIGLVPENAQSHFALASLLEELGTRGPEAQSEYARAHELDPHLVAPGAAAATIPAPVAPVAPLAAAVQPSPSAAPYPGAVPPASSGGQIKIKPIDRKFRLTHDSAVYSAASNTSNVVGQVHRRRYVHVVGIGGPWLQIKLKTGVVGFIPVSAAE